MTRRIEPDLARRIVVARQGFTSRRSTATAGSVADAIEQLGCVQLDSVMAVDRAHRLTLASRVGRIDDGILNTLRRDGRVFEYWAHEACILPIADYGHFDALRRRREHPWYGAVLEEHGDLARKILDDIASSGPRSPRSYGGGGGGWWEWSPVKKVFESLWTAGEIAVTERRGFERIYDLTERVIPEAVRTAPAPDEMETLVHLVRRAMGARGIVTAGRLRDYYRLRGRAERLMPAIDELVRLGEIERVEVDGHQALLDVTASEPAGSMTPVLLCPFDNLIWDREETRRLFGFSHMLEIYKPDHQRQYGYYVLPLLVSHRLVGRVDVRADRRGRALRLLATHWEGRPQPAQLERAAARLAWMLGLETVER